MAQNNVNHKIDLVAKSTPATEQRPNFLEEDAAQKTNRKIKENPMVPIGMAGFFGAVGYGIHHFKKRPKGMSASMYIMQFRVFAQSIAVGCMGLGIAYTILRDKYFAPDSSSTTDIKKKSKTG